MTYRLVQQSEYLVLQSDESQGQSPIVVDFLSGKSLHRRQYGGGKGQLIAKAIGVKRYGDPRVCDLTAGLGEDAFVLACLGCHVLMLERNEIVAALLEDGLKRLYADPSSKGIDLQLQVRDAKEYLYGLSGDDRPDVIYMDPMFPDKKKSALMKKEMQALREVVGNDADAGELLLLAKQYAKKRVVVKRPKHAEVLAGETPDLVFRGQSGRFDVYLV